MKYVWQRRTTRSGVERLEYVDEAGTVRGWVENDLALKPFSPSSSRLGTQILAFGLSERALKERIERSVK